MSESNMKVAGRGRKSKDRPNEERRIREWRGIKVIGAR